MTRVDFYVNAEDKFHVLRKLTERAMITGNYVLVLADSISMAKQLDTRFWTEPPLSFLPHVLSEHALAPDTPVLIGFTPGLLMRKDVVINFSHRVPEWFKQFSRWLDIVGVDSEDKASARNRYRFIKEHGYEINVHDLVINK